MVRQRHDGVHGFRFAVQAAEHRHHFRAGKPQGMHIVQVQQSVFEAWVELRTLLPQGSQHCLAHGLQGFGRVFAQLGA
ncbi:hypothetical protein D9M68_947660 [compost metagenome]